MTRVLRGAWSRRGALGTLVAMTAVVVGGVVVVLGFARAAGTSELLTAPLLLLGAVAVPAIGRELATARREEIGLARLRGVHGARLWLFLLVEPLLAVLLGTVVGLGLGWLVGRVVTRAWLGEAAPLLGTTTLWVALGIAAGGLVIVLAGSALAVREPLALQVSKARRPRPATTWALFLGVLVLAGAGVAAYRSTAGSTDEPDLLVLLGPALVGLALGQVAVWLLRLLARLATGPTSTRGLAPLLVARRLARTDELATPLRLVVAAAVVGALALTGAVGVRDWADTQARLVQGAPLSFPLDAGAVQALALTQRVDPEGQWLMAAVTLPSEGRPGERRAFVDAERYDTVVGDFLDGTPAGGAGEAVDALDVDAQPLVTRGDYFEVEARSVAQEADWTERPVVRLEYVADGDYTTSVARRLVFGQEGDVARARVRVEDCREACAVTGLVIEPSHGTRIVGNRLEDVPPPTLLLTRVRLGDLDVARTIWKPDPDMVLDPTRPQLEPLIVNTAEGLQVTPPREVLTTIVPEAQDRPLPALVARDTPAIDVLRTPGGDERPLARVAELPALPLVGAIGSLADLPTGVSASGPTVSDAVVSILAAADTPAGVLDELEAAAGSAPRTFDDVRRTVWDAAGADQALAMALMAAAAALVALLALAAGVARQLRGYRHDVAALRVLGVDLGTSRRVGRTELALITVLVVTAVVGGGWLAVRLILGGLPLLSPPLAAVPHDTSPSLAWLLAPAALAAVAVLVVGGRARAVGATATRPAVILRDEEG